MTQFIEHPLLGLVTVIAVGYFIGRIKIKSFSLGVAAVLFSGLFIAALFPELKIQQSVYELGLVLFVYTIGLSAGPGFFAALKQRGIRYNILVASILAALALLTVGFIVFLKENTVTAAGTYVGALTNTPALASIIESIPPGSDTPGNVATIAYSLVYPLGVMVPILMIGLLSRLWKIDHAKEALQAGYSAHPLMSATIKVTTGKRPVVHFLADQSETEVVVSRIETNGHIRLPREEDILDDGTLVTVVGTPEELKKLTDYLGERIKTPIGQSEITYRRIFVSNPDLVGIPLQELNLPTNHDIMITRIRRGDQDMVAHDDSVLQLGDRVRAVVPKNKMKNATDFLGDSYKELSEIDILTFSIGIALGLLVGLIPIPIPGGELKLGAAGGPLVVALILGYLGRTGPFVWRMPYSSNLTIRQIGLVIFLAGVGINAGPSFAAALRHPSVFLILGTGFTIVAISSLSVLIIGHKIMKIPFGTTAGILAGLQTQPAALVYSSEQAGNELPSLGYTTVYPVAMIVKIMAAQTILTVMLVT